MQGNGETTEHTSTSSASAAGSDAAESGTEAPASAESGVGGAPAADSASEVSAAQPDDSSGAEGAEPRRRRRAASRAAGPPVTPALEPPVDPSATPDDEPTVTAADSGGSGAIATVLFQAPAFEPPRPSKSAKPDPPASEPSGEDQARVESGEDSTGAPDQSAQSGDAGGADDDDDDDEDDDGTPKRRRRRRGGRGRRKKADSAEGDDDASADSGTTAGNGRSDKPSRSDRASGGKSSGASDPEGADGDSDSNSSNDPGGDSGADESDDESSAATRRRRRRKRKGDSEDRRTDDPPNTVVKVRGNRENQEADDEVTSVKGSTRLEAKKQRRREGREAGRRKPPILSEAEFLARREAVDRVMAVRQQGDLTQIAVLEDDVLVEHYVRRSSQTSLIGNVYLGRVQNVLPAMEAAFIDIGKGRNAVIYAGEVNWSEHEQSGGERRIEDVLKSGQSVLVQVTKDPVGHKGARLTSQISLPGRYVVYVPGGSMSGISRKLPDIERTRLKKILKQVVPDDAGVIVRTAAEGASEEELTNDVARLRDQWESIKKRSSGNGPALLQSEPDLAIKVVRDLFNEDFTKLVVSGDHAWDTINDYIGTVAGSLHDRLEKWAPDDGKSDLFDALRVNEQIAKALDRKVWLPSGGSLIIDRTEAMTVIDVNTGKFTGSGGNLEETVTKNNLEAAEEIVRQLRLRDIGGIVVIDFIDMVLEANRDLVLRRLVECLGRDRTKHQVAEVTSLGLVQMTRKRIGTGLLEAFGEQCPHCRGRGVVVHDHPVDGGSSNGSGSGANSNSGDSGRGSESSGGRSRRGRRRSSAPADSPAASETAEKDAQAEANHKPKLEASADPGHASPADLMPVAGESADADAAAGTEESTETGDATGGGDVTDAADAAPVPDEPDGQTADHAV